MAAPTISATTAGTSTAASASSSTTSTSRKAYRILLSNFDDGTFRHYAGDNAVWASADRSATSINSLVDIQEFVTAAPDVKAVFQANNTLVVRIAQDDGTLDIALPGYAAAYSNTFNADLF